MAEPKHKNCIAERDWLRREYERVTIEVEALKSQRVISALLAADRTQRERELIEETHRLRAQLADANEIARQAVEQAKAQKYRATVFADTAFEARYEAMRKVADAAVRMQTNDILRCAEPDAWQAFEEAVREYRALKEAV